MDVKATADVKAAVDARTAQNAKTAEDVETRPTAVIDAKADIYNTLTGHR